MKFKTHFVWILFIVLVFNGNCIMDNIFIIKRIFKIKLSFYLKNNIYLIYTNLESKNLVKI